MKRLLTCIIVLNLFSAGLFALEPEPGTDNNWPFWRGADMTGSAPNCKPPVEWSETKNIKWKSGIPGNGQSTPIIWDNNIFITSAIPSDAGKQKFAVFCYNRSNGKLIWQKTVREQVPHEGTHQTGSWASGSSVTDGELLFAHFGSNGLFCLDLNGNVKWEKDLGKMKIRNSFGEGISPALYGNTLIICWDHEGDSFIVALDKKSGKEIWRKKRDEPTSWSTPTIVNYKGKTHVIVNAPNFIRSYDLNTGNVFWEVSGMTSNTVPSPIFADGFVYCASGFRGDAVLAIDLAKAKGNITNTDAVIWQYDKDAPYVPSILYHKNALYFAKRNNGVFTSLDAKTGKVIYGPERLSDIKNIYASPVAANDFIYISGRDGTTVVVKHGPKFEIVATNKLDDVIDASIAIVGNELFIRGNKYLYCVSESK